MSIRYKLIALFLLITFPTVVIGSFVINRLVKVEGPLEVEIPQLIKKSANESNLQIMSEKIRYYDEILTQAARNYAFTEDKKWKEIYIEATPKLNDVIQSIMSAGENQDKEIFQEIDGANTELVKMETIAFELVDGGQAAEAVKVLESDFYWQQKEIYRSGLDRFAGRRGFQQTQSTVKSAQMLDKMVLETETVIDVAIIIVPVIIIMSFGLALLLGLLTSYKITKPIIDLKNIVGQIAQGNMDERVEVRTNDEIGELGKVFNVMADKLQQTQNEIEAKVADRTAELQKVNKYMVGRELRMIELKKKIKKLEKIK